jgi:uncharacterized membrane protein YcaP (DUF421 family)
VDWASMFYQNWSGIVRTAIVGTLAYATLVLALRVSGNRTLAKLNAFDLIVTVALGSTLATILLSEDVALAEGVTALLLLIILQYIVAFLSVRSRRFARLVRSEPTLLVHDGTLCRDAMRRARVTEEELETVLRTNGERHFDAVSAIILESDGSFSVIGSGKPRGKAQAGS